MTISLPPALPSAYFMHLPFRRKHQDAIFPNKECRTLFLLHIKGMSET